MPPHFSFLRESAPRKDHAGHVRTDLGPLSRIACVFISVVFSQPQRVPRLIHITEASLVPDQALGAHRCGASARARKGPSLTSDFNHSQLIVSMCRNPNFAWAQRKDRVFVTIEVPNCDKKASTVNIEGQSLKFKGKTDTQEYELDIELYGELNTEVRPAGRIGFLFCCARPQERAAHPPPPGVQESKYTIGDRNVQILLMRKEEGEHWPRLLKVATCPIATAHPKTAAAHHSVDYTQMPSEVGHI